MRRPAPATAVAAALAAVASGEAVSARGGGGGHGGGGHSSGGHSGSFGGFHSGGFHSGGFHSGYYGGNTGFFSSLAIALVTILIVVLVIYLFLLMRRSGRAAASGGGSGETYSYALEGGPDGNAADFERRALQAAPAGLREVESALEAIRAADPDFEAETFLQRAEMTFFLVSRAFAHVDENAGRPYFTPEAFEIWKRDVEGFAAAQSRPILDDLNVRGMHVVSASHGDAGDEIVVHFDLVYRFRVVSALTGAEQQDEGEDRRRGQRWTFRRAAGVKTLVDGGVVAQKCPQCGAPLELAADGRCRYCHADICAGAFDWTVGGIAAAEFEGVRPEPLFGATRLDPEAGFAAIRSADPQFDGAQFVQRVSGAFLALQQAWAARDLDVGRGFMSPGLYYGWSAQIETMAEEHRRNALENVQIHAIAPVAVVHGRAFDDVTVRIDASCVDYEIDETSGRMVFGSRDAAPFVEFWTFQRSTGAKTPEHGLLDKHCPNCGAPLDVNAVGQCTYCKAAITSGRFDWVLSRIEQEEEVAYG